MKIHPLWYLCILSRLSLVYFVNKYGTSQKYKSLIQIILIVISLGFLNKSINGSNKEIQITNVFWHDARIVHAVLFGLSTFLFYKNKINLSAIILFIDILFSIIYRLNINY